MWTGSGLSDITYRQSAPKSTPRSARPQGQNMTERTSQLHATADEQIGELLDLISTIDEATARRPCPGREKLGDGTVAANARHTADNYQRIAAFLSETDRTPLER